MLKKNKFKKIVILGFLIFNFTIIYSQPRLDYTKEELMQELADKNPEYYDYDGIRGVMVSLNYGTYTYFLNDSNIIYGCAFTPSSNEDLLYFINAYNTDPEYESISENEWKTLYKPTIRITLIKQKDRQLTYFSYQLEKDIK